MYDGRRVRLPLPSSRQVANPPVRARRRANTPRSQRLPTRRGQGARARAGPSADVFAYAAGQVKAAMDATHRLGGSNYVFWRAPASGLARPGHFGAVL